MSDESSARLAQQIDRLQAQEEIRQLTAKYALALDMRDTAAWGGLFPEDVRVGGGQVGRAALAAWFDQTMRERFTGTAHFTGNHIIEFDDAEHAHGVVYSRNEHEMDGEWVIMTMMYWDAYERIDGRWLFRRRLPLYWYATDLNKPPIGPDKMRWPDQDPYDGGWHAHWPSWQRFWDHPPEGPVAVAEPAPLGEFLARMRGDGAQEWSVRVK